MNTKSKILELLENNRGYSLSGEEIARQLAISRNAVWKAIKALEKDGYCIQAVTNKGYSLSIDNDILSVEGMLPYLSSPNCAKKIFVYKELESTNKTAKEMAMNGHKHGTVIIADSQTAGRGRYGRSFYSPPKSGLYMSFIFQFPALHVQKATLITTSVAVTICQAIQDVCGKEPKIKWINDILLEDKKVGGILTEAVTDFESGNIEWIVVGIGININTSKDSFPRELNPIAASIYSGEIDGATRNRLAAEFINRLLVFDIWQNDKEIYAEYKKRLSMLNERITVIAPNETYDALAMDVNLDGHLIVKKDDGKTVALSSGEISIKKSLNRQ